MELSSISIAITSAATLLKMTKTMSNIAGSKRLTEHIIKFQDEILTLQSKLLAAQQEQSDLIKIKNEIEKKLAEYVNWEKTASKYELHEIVTGIFVFALKKNDQSSEPKHYLCARCFNDHTKSILQLENNVLKCFNCKNNIELNRPDTESTWSSNTY